MISSGYMPISGIAGSYGCFTSSFLKNLPAVFHSGCICLYSHKQCKRIQFSLHPFQHLVFVDFFDDGPDDWCEVIPHCSFDLHFCNNEQRWASFCVFSSHLYVFSECLFRSSDHFLIELFVFLVLSCMSCLYILEINSLPIVSFASP